MMRGKRLARKLEAEKATAEGQKRAAAVVRCDWCGDWYSTQNAKAAEYHENGHCS